MQLWEARQRCNDTASCVQMLVSYCVKKRLFYRSLNGKLKHLNWRKNKVCRPKHDGNLVDRHTCMWICVCICVVMYFSGWRRSQNVWYIIRLPVRWSNPMNDDDEKWMNVNANVAPIMMRWFVWCELPSVYDSFLGYIKQVTSTHDNGSLASNDACVVAIETFMKVLIMAYN